MSVLARLVAGAALALSMPAAAAAQSPAGFTVRLAGTDAGQEAQGNPQPHGPALQRIVSLHLQAVRLEAALDAIDRQAGIVLEYTPRVVPVDRLVTVNLDSVTVQRALEAVLAGTGVHAAVTPSGKVILVTLAAQPDTGFGGVGGEIRDSASGRAVDALVTLGDTGAGAPVLRSRVATDSGRYWFDSVAAGAYVLRVRQVGYRPASRTIQVVGGQPLRVDFHLYPTPTQLDAIVATATGPRRRLDMGNDITILNADSIVKNVPIANLTQLLEGRVPGLDVIHSTGTPGDPSRLRLRGPGSALSSNDPIVIVNGVRVYSAVSDSMSANLASLGPNAFAGGGGTVAAPSPLDQIDPNTVETVEVFKGPSASTMYGPDAANGVIVITTKKGRPGPARWTASVSSGMSYLPGRYPAGMYRWGTSLYGVPVICQLSDQTCRPDSLVTFQALNDPRYTILGRGHTLATSLGVSGGAGAITYSLTASTDNELGILTLPAVQAQQYQQQVGAPPPSWMRRPDGLGRWSGAATMTARLDDRTTFSVMSSLTRENQQRSDLDQELATEMSTYVDRGTGAYYRGVAANGLDLQPALLPDFYTKATDDATHFTNQANLSWQPRPWLQVNADAGLDVISRHDQVFLPTAVLPTDSGGNLSDAHGSIVTSSVNLRAQATAALPLGFRFLFNAGANYDGSSASTLATDAANLLQGTSSLDGAGQLVSASQSSNQVTNIGWYVEPSVSSRRLSLSTGLRIDGSSAFGTHATLPKFPKLDASYLVSDEPWFPFKRIFNVLRVRAAYGQAGVWPSASEQYRLYQQSRPWLDGGIVTATTISTLGNTKIRPERSSELEGGFDADVLDDRLSVRITAYRKMRYDALMPFQLPPSVNGGASITRNVGTIRNTGVELSVTAGLVRSEAVTWSATMNFSSDRNKVLALGQGILPFFTANGVSQVVPGYPLDGYWSWPIVGYYDANHDGVIEPNEVQLGNNPVYMGAAYPNWQATFSTQLALFGNALMATANFSYQAGLTQLNSALHGSGQFAFFDPGLVSPSATLAQQAVAVAAAAGNTQYGLIQTVNTLRLTSVSVGYNFPRSLARVLGADAVSVLLQGTNLGLWSNYRGKDPDVSSSSLGDVVFDSGALPMPRTWFLTMRLAY